MQLHGTATGWGHYVTTGAGYQFQMVAGPCQYFLSRPGVRWASAGSTIAGGIPYIPDGCTAYPDGPAPDECWWSTGDALWPPGSNTLRTAIGYQGGMRAWSGYFHRPDEDPAGALITPGVAYDLICVEQVFALNPGDYGALNTRMEFPQDEPYLYEPLLAWGDKIPEGEPAANYPPKVRGQIWDALVLSGPGLWDEKLYGSTPPIEGLLHLEGDHPTSTWLNYTMNPNPFWTPGFLGNLYLLLPGSGGGGGIANVAY